MKLYISADIEGVACIAAPTEADPRSPDYEPYRRQMTAEVRAACEGAFDVGAQSIVVKDAHGPGRNIDPQALDAPEGRSLQLIRGWSGHPFSMVEGLDDSYAMVAFVGYHSAAGRSGNPLAHTVSGRLFSQIRLNDQVASEFHLFALAAATVGVPVGFVSGDEALCGEAAKLVEGILAVPTLAGAGHGVRSILPQAACRAIRSGVKQAVSNPSTRPLAIPTDLLFELDYVRASDAYPMSFYPGVKQVGDRTLRLETRNYMDVLALLRIASRMP